MRFDKNRTFSPHYGLTATFAGIYQITMIQKELNNVPEDLYKLSPWPLSWTAVITGALATLAAITIFGLFGTAAGIGALSEIKDFSTWQEVNIGMLAGAIFGAFFANVIGGWVAGKITGTRYAEPAILHGAIAWLISIPILLVFLAIGAGKTFGGWYGGIVGAVGSSAPGAVVLSPLATRHIATTAATALLVGLIGSVLGGWMASGEPMSINHHKTRARVAPRP
jgi:hypothetical protein